MKEQFMSYDIKLQEYEQDLEKNLENCIKLNHPDKEIVITQLVNAAETNLNLKLEGTVLDIIEHYNQEKYPKQKVAFILISSSVYLVPFLIKSEDLIEFKTSFFSSKASALYLDNQMNNS
jgi:hypothetical protein